MKSFFVTAGFVLLLTTAQAQKKLNAISTSKGTVVEHKVTSGESLVYLSAKYDVILSSLAKANGLKTDQDLKIGQVLKVPVTGSNLVETKKNAIPVYYEVGAKDNLSSISKKFGGVSTKTLKNWNNLKKDALPKGKELLVGYMVDNYAGKKTAKEEEKETTKVADTKNTRIRGTQKATVAGTSLNVRKGPGTDKDIVANLQQNDELTITRKINDEWVAVRTADGKEGFAASRFLIIDAAPALKESPAKPVTKGREKTMVVTGTSLNIRKGPKTSEAILATAMQDEAVTVVRQVNSEWVAVKTVNGVDGYAASQFLGPVGAVTKKAEVPKNENRPFEMAVVGTSVNIRKGPATNEPIVGNVLQDETLTVLRKVNNEWVAVRTASGVEGYAASLFLGPVRDGEMARTEPKPARQQQRNDQPEPGVSSAPINTSAATTDFDESGFFKTAYDEQNGSSKTRDKTMRSGVFRTDKGWADGKYYALVDGVTAGTVVKLSNPSANTAIYAKVLGDVKSLKQKKSPAVRISDAAAAALRINDTNFDVVVTH